MHGAIPEQITDDASMLMRALTLKTLRAIEAASSERLAHDIHEHFNRLHEEINAMSPQVTLLVQEVAEIRSASQSLIALVQGISALLIENQNDAAAIVAIAADLDAETAAITTAVNTFTPPAPPTP
jgi:hypothetical protein